MPRRSAGYGPPSVADMDAMSRASQAAEARGYWSGSPETNVKCRHQHRDDGIINLCRQTIDGAIMQDILARNVSLVLMALNDAQAYREDIGDDKSAEVYEQLAAELEDWQLDG